MAIHQRGARRQRPKVSRSRKSRLAGPRIRATTSRLLDSESQQLAHLGSWEWDAVRNVVTWSPELYRIYGLSREDFDGTYEGFLARVHEQDRAVTREVVARAFREGLPFDYDHRIVRPDGEIRMLETRGGVVHGPDGAVVRLVGCCMDVTEQWRTRQRLDDSLALLRATLDSTQDGIFVVDLEGGVRVCNRRARELWGLPESLAVRGDVGMMLDFVRPQLERPDDFMAAEQRLRNDPSASGYDTVRFKDGRVFERYTRPQIKGDRIVGRVCSFRDVTAREQALEALERLTHVLEARVRQRTRDLRRKTEELERSNAELEIFAAAASHDLNAPLRRIISFTELLRRRLAGKVGPEESSLLARVCERAEGMTRLIDDILMLARASRQTLPVEDVALDQVAREVTTDLEPLLEQSGGTLDVGPLPVVRGHPSLYRLLLQNLLANALKFRAPDRSPRVVLRSKALPLGGVELSVEDNGIGFDDRFAREIFMPFRRLHPASEYEGSGIGLTTCERIVHRYGGTITARGVRGKGSVFFVRLPPASVARA